MPSVENDLYDTYLSEKNEIDNIDDILSQTLKIFNDFYDNDTAWPYEIRHDENDGKAKRPNRFSFSTTIMILHSIAASLGKLKGSHIAFGIDRNSCIFKIPKIYKELTEDLLEKYEKSLELIIQKSKLEKKVNKIHVTFDSSNFGINDPFSYSWFLEIFYSHSNGKHSEYKSQLIKDAIGMLERSIKSLEKGDKGFLIWRNKKELKHYESLRHSFPLLRAINVLLVLYKNEENEVKSLFENNIEKLSQHCLSCIYRHLSLKDIEHGDFDVAELVLSLEAYLLLTQQSKININKNMLDRIFNIIEESQKTSTYWRPLKPFVKTKSGFVLLPLSIEITNSLLRICHIIRESYLQEDYFTPYVHIFRKYTTWLLTRVEKNHTSHSSDQKQFTGWHSENVLETGVVHPWDTSQVVLFLLQYRASLKEHIAKKSLEETNLYSYKISRKKHNKSSSPIDAMQYWIDNWQDTEPLSSLTEESSYCVLKRIGEKYIKPRLENNDGEDPFYSMLLYGPPGTGKTAIAEEIAKSLQWNFINITPSNFIKKGESEVENRANNIFTALLEQNNCVILFDEIDRLILDRDSGDYHKQSDIFQFMTPSMLVKFKKLRDKNNSIFIIATNYEERIDPAIKRVGRIDENFLIVPPDSAQRWNIIKKILASEKNQELKSIYDRINKDDIITTIERTCLYKFGELKKLTNDVMNEFAKNEITKTALVSCFDSAEIPPPELTLSKYKNLIFKNNRKNNNITSNQKPYEEYLILFYLKYIDVHNESSQDRTDVVNFQKVVKGICNNKTPKIERDFKDSIKPVIKDNYIINKLYTFYNNIPSDGNGQNK